MAIRKPSTSSRRSRQTGEQDLFDVSKVDALIPTPEQVAEQMVQLAELLAEWEREFGPIPQEDINWVERHWPASP